MNVFNYFQENDFSDLDSLDTNSSVTNSSFSLDDEDEYPNCYCCCFFLNYFK